MNSNYPGKSEILAVWKWGVSKERTPITTSGEAATAMDLAYRAFEERDKARAALDTLPEELAYAKKTCDCLRAECRRALDERDAHKKLAADANRDLNVAKGQRTAALVMIAALLIVLAFAL
jgi:hypothetical protein